MFSHLGEFSSPFLSALSLPWAWAPLTSDAFATIAPSPITTYPYPKEQKVRIEVVKETLVGYGIRAVAAPLSEVQIRGSKVASLDVRLFFPPWESLPFSICATKTKDLFLAMVLQAAKMAFYLQISNFLNRCGKSSVLKPFWAAAPQG